MKSTFIVIMGVSGSGKTSVGQALAKKLGWDFYDADDFHPPANISKMAYGIPLTDADRLPWLIALNQLINQKGLGVLACSALKESYRHILIKDNAAVKLIYLKGSYDLINTRLQARAKHYMKPELLKSQFDALEEPQNALMIDISKDVNQIVENIIAKTNP